MKQRVSDREWHGKENPRSRYAVTNPRCLGVQFHWSGAGVVEVPTQ